MQMEERNKKTKKRNKDKQRMNMMERNVNDTRKKKRCKNRAMFY